MGLIEKIFVSKETKAERMECCGTCPHFTEKGFCGNPLIGETVKYLNKRGVEKEAKLCGCKMSIKATLKLSYCPIGRWNKAELIRGDVKFVKEVKALLDECEGLEVAPNDLVRRIYAKHNKTHGSKNDNSGCPECVVAAISDLKEWHKKATG